MSGVKSAEKMTVYLEIGRKRVFAGAVEWLGWCRSGPNQAAALAALAGYGDRYRRVVAPARLGFTPVRGVAGFSIVERLKGDATTDFGAPGGVPKADNRPLGAGEIRRVTVLLRAIWSELDRAIEMAVGRDLRKGPRGGGRDLRKIVEHVLDADDAYLRAVGWKAEARPAGDWSEALRTTRQAILAAMEANAAGQIALRGPRGGQRWSARTFVRRAAWHALDHAWEIEDRVV